MADQERPSNQRQSIDPANMPPLEPTAEVPAVHSDKLNDPAYWNDKLRSKTAKVPVEHRDVQKPGIAKKVIAAIAGVAVLGGGAFVGVKTLAGGGDSAKPEARPTNSAPVTPGETAGSTETKTDAASGPFEFAIPAAEFETNPHDLAVEYNSLFNKFLIAGADEKAAHADERYEMVGSKYVLTFSKAIDQKFVDELFVDDWYKNEELAQYVDRTMEIAHDTRQARLLTYTGGTEDKEPYVRETILDEIAGTTNPLVTSMRWHEHANTDMNTAEDVLTGVDVNSQYGGQTFTWKNVDGQLKISGISHYDG